MEDDDRSDEVLPQRDTGQSDDPSEEIENRIYMEELLHSMPLKFILSGLSKEELRLFKLRYVKDLSSKEIAKALNQNVGQVSYDLNKLIAKIRYRARLHLKQTGGNSPL